MAEKSTKRPSLQRYPAELKERAVRMVRELDCGEVADLVPGLDRGDAQRDQGV